MSFITTRDELLKAIIERPRWVAECLQRIGRFNGQHPTSNVLLHSLDVYDLLDDEGSHSQSVLTWCCLHDVHEILSGDMSRSWKTTFQESRQNEIDWHLQSGLGIKLTASESEVIRDADKRSGDEERERWERTYYAYAHDPVGTWLDIVTRWTSAIEARK